MRNSYPPTHEQFAAFLKKNNISVGEVAKMIGAGERTVYDWLNAPVKGRSNRMGFCQWYTLISLVEGKPPGRLPAERR